MRAKRRAWTLLLLISACCGCAAQSAGVRESSGISNRQGKKLADLVGTFVWQGQGCAFFRGVEPMPCNPDVLGVPDDQVPNVLEAVLMCKYTLTKMGTQVGLSGVYPARVGANARILIPRRHVERFLQSSLQTQAFKLTDP